MYKQSVSKPSNNSPDEKLTKQLIGRIYAETDISKYRYDMLNYESDLQKILKNKYYASINFYGTNCLLVFTKILDKFYSFTVDRQTLSYNFSKVDFSKVKINMVNINLDDQIYNGTIFEGILIKRYNSDDVYVISDVYKFCGKDVTKDKLNIKLMMLVEYLKSNYDKDIQSNTLELEVNKLFELNKFNHFIDNVLPKVKHLKYRGICFYPEISETKLIFNINTGEQKQDTQHDKQRDQQHQDRRQEQYQRQDIQPDKRSEQQQDRRQEQYQQQDQRLENTDKKVKYINESDEDVYAVLDLKPSDNPDVYKVYCVEKQIKDKKTVLKKIPMGIAHIRGIQLSHMLRKVFENKKSSLFKCKFNNDNSKWEPVEEEKQVKIPTLLEEIESKLIIMELSDDDE